jgi:hypothetical protein
MARNDKQNLQIPTVEGLQENIFAHQSGALGP